MKFGIAAVFVVLACSGCASQVFSGSAALSDGRLVDLGGDMKTLDECAASVRAAYSSPNPAELGQVVQSSVTKGFDDALGICAGPDGRVYFIRATEIVPGPSIVFEH